MKHLPAVRGSDVPEVDIEGLIPGQHYVIRVTFSYILNNKTSTHYLDNYITTSKFYISLKPARKLSCLCF